MLGVAFPLVASARRISRELFDEQNGLCATQHDVPVGCQGASLEKQAVEQHTGTAAAACHQGRAQRSMRRNAPVLDAQRELHAATCRHEGGRQRAARCVQGHAQYYVPQVKRLAAKARVAYAAQLCYHNPAHLSLGAYMVVLP